MFSLQKLKNWTHSSISSDKQELEIYEYFKNEIENIKKVRKSYIDEEGREDISIYTEYNGEIVPISFLKTYKESVLHDKSLDAISRARKQAMLEDMYRERLKELENRIISMAISIPDNVYLKQISSYINILNQLLRKYAYLLAIQRSGLTTISSEEDLKKLEDNILIRSSEIQKRITIDTMKRY